MNHTSIFEQKCIIKFFVNDNAAKEYRNTRFCDTGTAHVSLWIQCVYVKYGRDGEVKLDMDMMERIYVILFYAIVAKNVKLQKYLGKYC